MNIPKSDIKIETMRGSGPGGQHRNKTDSCVRATHVPTGLSVTIDGRSQHKNRRAALKALSEALRASQEAESAAQKKAERDRKVRYSRRVRTYDQTNNRVTDHRSGLKRRFDDVVRRGNLDDLLDL